jgi:hypothetical protein
VRLGASGGRNSKGHWFGLIKTMRGLQMWANKWPSQTLHILNTTANAASLPKKTPSPT